MLPKSGSTGAQELARRTPGETDLRIFTPELIPPGRHRVDRLRPRPRVARDRLTGRPVLRVLVPGAEATDPVAVAFAGALRRSGMSGDDTSATGDMAAVAGRALPPATEQDYRRQIGKRARLARVGLDASQDDIATKAGVTRNYVSATERGAQGLDAWRLRCLADALGVTLVWLLGLTDQPPPSDHG